MTCLVDALGQQADERVLVGDARAELIVRNRGIADVQVDVAGRAQLRREPRRAAFG